MKPIDTMVHLDLVMKNRDMKEHCYSGDFYVLDMKKKDLIIGLPALTGELYPFMNQKMLEANELSLEKASEDFAMRQGVNSISLEASDEDIPLINPWVNSNPLNEVAPEDEETDLPVNFGDALMFLGKPREEAILDYLKLIEERVSPEMKESTDIINYLKREDIMSVFVPDDWSGIKDIPPLKVKWKDTLPERMKPQARPINPRLWAASEKEFQRLCGYFYKKSRSSWASCLVVAPKATPPYIRFCGDYVRINKHMEVGNYTIPNVRHELGKIINFKCYLDIDLTNAFHQILLHPDTAEKLSIQTPWGQFEPLFMPEGIAPATGILQEVVKDIFEDIKDWSIVIFDNMLLLANSMEDAFEKFQEFMKICMKKNLKLKMAKSWLGFKKVSFFGYDCKHKSYEVSPDKKEALAMIPFPHNTKTARSLLGKGVFFASFTPNYSDLIAHLTDMTKSTFNWDTSKWKHDYRAEFDTFIKGLQAACEIFYPDYNLEWVLRTDASELGVGGVLLQMKILESGIKQPQPVAFISKKFSDPATRWSTIEQEAFGIFLLPSGKRVHNRNRSQ